MTIDFHSMLRRMRFRVVTSISARPSLYYGLRKITGTMDHLCVRDDTELVIEGYPRSANSTTVWEFLNRQPRPVKVAHHKHHAAQLLFASKHNIPAVLLIRQPEQAVLSNLALALEVQQRNPLRKRGTLTFQDTLLSWLVFYRAVEDYTDAFVIAPFEEVTQDIGGMIKRINSRFGTVFADQTLSQERAKPLGWHATPNEIRSGIKNELSEQFALALSESTQLKSMLNEANDLYQKFIVMYESQNLACKQALT